MEDVPPPPDDKTLVIEGGNAAFYYLKARYIYIFDESHKNNASGYQTFLYDV